MHVNNLLAEMFLLAKTQADCQQQFWDRMTRLCLRLRNLLEEHGVAVEEADDLAALIGRALGEAREARTKLAEAEGRTAAAEERASRAEGQVAELEGLVARAEDAAVKTFRGVLRELGTGEGPAGGRVGDCGPPPKAGEPGGRA